MKIKIGLVDDHQLFLKSLSLMVATIERCEVVIEAVSGNELKRKLEHRPVSIPDIMLVDVNMPGMDGVEVAKWLQSAFPIMKMIALSMNNKDQAIINMFKAGCCSYLLKDVHPAVLEKALVEVYEHGYFNADTAVFQPGKILQMMNKHQQISVTPKEQQFLRLACSDLTYKQIAAEMGVSERTVDGYRESLFYKFGVQSRVGLCLEAIRKGFVEL